MTHVNYRPWPEWTATAAQSVPVEDVGRNRRIARDGREGSVVSGRFSLAGNGF